jgi:hypothetical protein
MKTDILKRSFIALALAAVVSCSGFLDENPTTTFPKDAVYSTPEGVETVLFGCYNSMHSSSLWKGTMAEFFHTASGLMIWKGQRLTDEWLDGMYLTKYSTSNSGNKRIWDAIWSGINKCNSLLDNLPESPVDEAYKTEVAAEAKFIRALMYYTAVRIWGDVPLILSCPESTDKIFFPRTAWYKVYAQVLADLDFAEANMRDKARQDEVNFEKSRPNKWAATAFKASVYLTIGSLLAHPDDNFWDSGKDAALIAEGKDPRTPDFSSLGILSAEDAFTLALATAENVILNGPYSLVPDYRTLFRWTEHGDWFLPEAIFVLTSTNMGGDNYNSSRMLPNYPEGSSNYYTSNKNPGRARPSRFAVDNFIKYSGGTQEDDPASPAYTLYMESADPRYKATFFRSFKNLNTGSTVSTYPSSARVGITSSDYSVPYYKKYLDPTYDVTNGYADFYFMRLAELYLISAEAAASMSQAPGDMYWTSAINRVNDLRKRARQSKDGAESTVPADWQADDFTDRQELINAIFWERLIELSAEGHEYFDTHRFGATWLRDNIAVPQNTFLEENPNQYIYWEYTYVGAEARYDKGGHTFPTEVQDLRRSLLCAYPESEIRLNTALKYSDQNDFYWQ